MATAETRLNAICFYLLALMVIGSVAFLLLPSAWVREAYVLERRQAGEVFGEDTRRWLDQKADRWFKRLVIDSGLLSGSYALCSRAQNDPFDDRGLGALFAGRFDVLWTAVRLYLFRLMQLGIWGWCAVVFLAPLVADAGLQRRIRQYQSSHSSPTVHKYSRLAFWSAVGWLLMGPATPIALPPLSVPLNLALGGAAFWVMWALAPKRV